MNIEFTDYFEDAVSCWELSNKTNISNLIKRCLFKKIIKKEAFELLMVEVDNWNGRKL